MKNNVNVLLIWDRMGDYHRARWSALQKAMPDEKIFAADLGGRDDLYGWVNTGNASLYFQLSRKDPSRFDPTRILKFIKILSTHQINAICIPGYGKPEYIFFLLYGWLTRRKVVLFAESWYPGNRIFDLIKGCFLRLTCDGFLVSGIRALNHFTKRLQIDIEKVKMGYSVVDNNHFADTANSAAPGDQKVLLCVARFVPEKNLELLIKSFLISELPHNRWVLTIIGGGPLKSSLEALSMDKPIKLCNWQSYEDLPAIYHKSSCLVLPSLFEPWGLVVNEAMAAGLPVILSDQVGCLPDLLEENNNGWSFDSTSQAMLVNIFNKVASSNSSTLSQYGNYSSEIIETYSLSLFANNLKALILKS